jgi:hypothetical protein
MFKKTIIHNYIPHKTPSYTNYSLWYKTYYNYLVDLFSITCEILNKRYGNHSLLNSFDEFCMSIYKSSSKYITKF